jgi:hypothetical protein
VARANKAMMTVSVRGERSPSPAPKGTRHTDALQYVNVRVLSLLDPDGKEDEIPVESKFMCTGKTTAVAFIGRGTNAPMLARPGLSLAVSMGVTNESKPPPICEDMAIAMAIRSRVRGGHFPLRVMAALSTAARSICVHHGQRGTAVSLSDHTTPAPMRRPVAGRTGKKADGRMGGRGAPH